MVDWIKAFRRTRESFYIRKTKLYTEVQNNVKYSNNGIKKFLSLF